MKNNFLYSLSFLFVFIVHAVALPQYGSLEWDHELYRQRKHIDPQHDRAMDYVHDLNQRIGRALHEGNILRADYLSSIVLKLLSTGGPYGIRKTGPTSDELKTINHASTLMARSYEVMAHHFSSEGSDKDAPEERTESYIFDRFKVLDNVISREQTIQPPGHVTNLKGLVLTHLMGIDTRDSIVLRSNQFSLRKRRNQMRVQAGVPPLPLDSPFPDGDGPITFVTRHLYAWLDPESKTYRNTIFSRDVKLKVFYQPNGQFDNQFQVLPIIEDGRVILYDFTHDQKFLFEHTPADNTCWLHAMAADRCYSLNDFSRFLKNLSDEDRKRAALFMASHFFNTIRDHKKDYTNETLTT